MAASVAGSGGVTIDLSSRGQVSVIKAIIWKFCLFKFHPWNRSHKYLFRLVSFLTELIAIIIGILDWVNCDNGSCKHCKQYSVRGSVIKTYNEPLTDYLQSISAEVFSLGKHDTGPCLESSAWVWRMRRGSEETRAWYALGHIEITPGYDTKKLRRWITWREIIIMFRTDKHSTVLFPGQDYSLDPLFCWHRGWH